MRIDGKLPYAASSAAAGARPGAAAGRFEVRGEAGARRPGAVAASAPLATMDAILALQGEDPSERRRRHARRGSDLLEALDGLKAQLLSGRVSASDLKALAARLAERPGSSGDPRLDEIVGQIELRAEVELAKLAAGRG